MLVKDKHTQCYDEIIKNGSLKSYFFCLYREKGENHSQFSNLNSQISILKSRFSIKLVPELVERQFSILEIGRMNW
jgi:hypothetical protein